MDILEKARAYDEALERAEKELHTCDSTDCDAARQIFRFFPEFKESEDEKVRKEIIDYCHERLNTTYGALPNIKTIKRWLIWLEKQKPLSEGCVRKTVAEAKEALFESEDEKIRENIISFLRSKNGYMNPDEDWDFHNRWLPWLEKQGATIKKTEHKFSIGDIISNGEVVYRVDDIVKNCVGKDCYFLVNIKIEKDEMRYATFSDSEGNPHNRGETTWLCEQVDVSFQKQLTQPVTKMSDKVWSEEDEKELDFVIVIIKGIAMSSPSKQYRDILYKSVDWLKSLNDRLKGE